MHGSLAKSIIKNNLSHHATEDKGSSNFLRILFASVLLIRSALLRHLFVVPSK